MELVRLHLIPFSTNVERVTLACGLKRIAVQRTEHDPSDRAEIERLSGQPLVPVAEIGGEVIADSMAILRRLDRLAPEPPLWPVAPALRAQADVFIEWFDSVWKRPPNLLTGDPPAGRRDEALNAISVWTARFDDLLQGRRFLLGNEITVADVCAYPFLRYAAHPPDPGDEERFHAVLHETQAPGSHPRLDDWIARISELPQA